jgi:uncharacterized membrane-anchored protein YitT (DUF2179 family)
MKKYDKSYIKHKIISLIVIFFASICYGAGVSLFLDANNLAPGGVTGIAIILNRVIGIETGTISFIINIPIMIIGWYKFGGKFMIYTVYTIILTSMFINFFHKIPPVTDDLLLAAITGGVLIAFSIGTIFKAGATTGGVDIIVRLIKLKYKHMKTGGVFLILDMIVVALSMIVFRDIEISLYAAITVVVSSYTMDLVIYGKDEAKLFYIMSRTSETEAQITKELLEVLEVGVTYLEASGSYSNTKRRVIMCAVRKQQLPKAKEIVKEIDENAFMIVTSATEIFGEGYKRHGG